MPGPAAAPSPRFAPVPIGAAGLVSITIYGLAFLRPYPLAEWWQHAIMDYTAISDYRLAAQAAFVGSFAALFAVYHWAAGRVRDRPAAGPLWLILAVQLAAGLVLTGMYPVTALDVYDYVLYARLGLYWGANPLVEPPAQYPDEPTLGFSYWPNEPSVYGPLWQVLSEHVIDVVDGQVLEGLVAFKLLALAAVLATTVVVWFTLRRLRPELASAGALLWAWNPLQLFETAGNAHNDAVVVLCLALSLLLLARGARLLALPVFVAGLLVKVTLAPLAPLLVLTPLLGRAPLSARVVRLVAGGLLASLLVVVSYAPYWMGRRSLPFLDRGNWFTASPPTLLREALRARFEFDTAGQIAATLCASVFALVALAMLARLVRHTWRTPEAHSTLLAVARTGYHLDFTYLVMACLWWQPWYLLALLVLAVVSGERALIDRAKLFCLGGVLSYPVFKYIWPIHQADWQLDYGKIMAMSVVVIFTLPLLHLAGSIAPAWLRPSDRGRRGQEPVGSFAR